jgi:predicted dehydrogenase
MNKEIKLGLIGLDTSHVEGFARAFNDADNPRRFEGARIVTGFPGGSPDFAKSADRVAGYTEKLSEQFGVRIVDSPEAVAESCDAILLTSVDGRVHFEQFSKIAAFGKPVFIDKPFAVTSEDARKIVALGETHGVPLMSSSPLRFATELTSALNDREAGAITGADFIGPMAIEPTQPGFFWYGVHTAEALFQVMGRGCREVFVMTSDPVDVAVGLWPDGRMGTIRGYRGENYFFRATLHRTDGVSLLDLDAGEPTKHFSLTAAILEFFRTGNSPIPPSESAEIVRFLEAANESRATGQRVTL